MDSDFGNWLAGFFDGEGCFTVNKNPIKNSFQCRAAITLRRDDESILHEIVRQTEIGSIFYPKPGVNKQGLARNPMATWNTTSKFECVKLVEIFDKCPLRAKKSLDYEVWRAAVLAWAEVKGRWSDNSELWNELEQCSVDLKSNRVFR